MLINKKRQFFYIVNVKTRNREKKKKAACTSVQTMITDVEQKKGEKPRE